MAGKWTLLVRVRRRNLIAAVEREVMEETGVRVAADRLVEVVEISDRGFHHVIHDHLCTQLIPAPRRSPTRRSEALRRRQRAASLGVSEEVTRVVMARRAAVSR
jgi:8-oxo-dGTP pyrophosphatase MutT (NUDIX family)